MRPSTHEVVLPGGRLALPLRFAGLRALAQIAADPTNPEAGCIDPSKVVRGTQDLALVTVVEAFHSAAGKDSPGLERICELGTPRELTVAFVEYCVAVVMAMGPPKPEATDSPKS